MTGPENIVPQSIPEKPSRMMRQFGTAWGILGFFALLLFAIFRLAELGLGAFEIRFSLLHWMLLFLNTAFMAYSEGYKGFQKAYSPRFAARCKYLLESGKPRQLLLAPFFCMSFFDAPRKRVITSYALLIMIVCLVIIFRLLPQPWRGILDAGVVVGLSWGVASTVYYLWRVLVTERHRDFDPEVI